MTDAIIVQTQRRGPHQMLGMGSDLTDAVGNLFNTATGNVLPTITDQAARLEVWLKVSVLASVVAGLASLGMLYYASRRR